MLQNFQVDGGAAIIPAGTSTVNLSSYGSQPELQFGLSSSDITSATSFSVTLADQLHLRSILTGVTTIEEIADVLNRSRDVSGNAHTFRTSGLFASGGGSTLTIASNDQNFPLGQLVPARQLMVMLTIHL